MPYAEDGGVRLHYRDAGEGIAVVLIHAFPLHGGMWRAQQEALAGRARILAPDLMGFGESDAPEDDSAYSVERFASNVLAVMESARVERAVVGGLSMGGYVALALWRRAAERITGLVLADTRAEADTEEIRARRTSQQGRIRAEGTAALVEEQLPVLLSNATRERRLEVVAETRALMERNPAAGWTGALEAMKKRGDATHLLHSISVPALIVAGEHDVPTPPALARSLRERIRGSRLVIVPDAGHLSSLEQPSHFSRALADFVAGLGV